MFRVTSSPEKNRLYTTLAGYLEATERQEAMKAILAEAGGLSPSFDVVTDISALHASNSEGFKDFLRTKSALKLKGADRIIRVVKIPLSRIQVERITQSSEDHATHAATVAEADLQLDAYRAQKASRF
jgi:hypothetical protein